MIFTKLMYATVISFDLNLSFSFQWGKEKSEKWLAAVLLSFAEDTLLLQPIKVGKSCADHLGA